MTFPTIYNFCLLLCSCFGNPLGSSQSIPFSKNQIFIEQSQLVNKVSLAKINGQKSVRNDLNADTLKPKPKVFAYGRYAEKTPVIADSLKPKLKVFAYGKYAEKPVKEKTATGKEPLKPQPKVFAYGRYAEKTTEIADSLKPKPKVFAYGRYAEKTPAIEDSLKPKPKVFAYGRYAEKTANTEKVIQKPNNAKVDNVIKSNKTSTPPKKMVGDKSIKSELPKNDTKLESALKIGPIDFSKPSLRTTIRNQMDSLSPVATLNEILKRELFINEAKKRGYETDPEFNEEFNTYQKIALDKLLFTEKEIQSLKNESYLNYQKEINLSHIFIAISQYADPLDTLVAYSVLNNIRNEALQKNNFAELAKINSKDLKTSQKGGLIGWLTSFNLIYPLEKIAFTMQTDSISMPIRTKYGYHLLKLNDQRPNSGQIKVQHIFKYCKADISEIELNKKFMLMDSLKTVIDQGANFNDICKNYSDDFNSRNQNGILPVFGVGSREESNFEDAAFNLKMNEVSKPIKSANGLHIIKLIERFPPMQKNEYFNSIAEKIITDSRGEYLMQQKIAKLKNTQNFKINTKTLNKFLEKVDSKIFDKEPFWTKMVVNNDTLFELNNEATASSAFASFLKNRSLEKFQNKLKPKEVINMQFDVFSNKKIMDLAVDKLISENKDLQTLLELEREELLLSKFKNDVIFEKSMADTLGLRKFYEANKQLFPAADRAEVRVLKFENESIFKKFSTERYKPKPYQLNRGIKPIYFPKNSAVLQNEDKRKLVGLMAKLAKNEGYLVEIGGHVDEAENESVSQERVKTIIGFLVEGGLPLTRILEVDYKYSKNQDRLDASNNQRVSFQFFSNLEADLIKTFNSQNPNSIVLTDKTMTKKEVEEEFNTPWKSGVIIKNELSAISEITIRIKKVNAFKENKGAIIAAYQNKIENDLLSKLLLKNKINSNEGLKIIEEIKNQK